MGVTLGTRIGGIKDGSRIDERNRSKCPGDPSGTPSQGVGQDLVKFRVAELDGISLHAAGFLRLSDDLREFSLGDAPVRKPRDPEPGRQFFKAADQVFGALSVDGPKPMGGLDVSLECGASRRPLSEGRDVGLGHGGQEGGADGAVGSSGLSAERTRQAMNGTEAGVGEREATVEGSECKIAAGGQAVPVLERPRQGRGDPGQRVPTQDVCHGIRSDRDERLKELCQRIQPRRRRQMGRPSASSGSMTASLGHILGLLRLTFTRCCGEDRTAFRVASDPVPAVVGTAAKGSGSVFRGVAFPITSR